MFELSKGWLGRLFSFIVWSNMYLYIARNLPEKKPEWCSRLITLCHGVFAAIVGFHQCTVLHDYNQCSRQLTAKVRPLQYALMIWSWGYFAFDLLWCVLYWPGAKLMLCHHVSSLAAITIYMYQDYTGCTFACTMALMEITNPLLQIRWFLKEEGYADTYFFLFIEVLYLALFLTLRGILGSYLVVKILKANIFSPVHKIMVLVLYLVSLGFLYDIIGYVLYKYKKEIDIGYKQFIEYLEVDSLNFYEWKPSDKFENILVID